MMQDPNLSQLQGLLNRWDTEQLTTLAVMDTPEKIVVNESTWLNKSIEINKF